MALSKVLVDEKLAETVRNFPILYDKESKDFKDKKKKDLVWNDVAKEVGFPSGTKTIIVVSLININIL